MDSNELIEQKIWEYLDGLLSPAEEQQVKMKIDTEVSWKKNFDLASELNKQIGHLQSDTPSPDFKSRVMSEIAAIHDKKRSKLPLVPAGIIAAFFVASIVYLLFKLSATSIDPPSHSFLSATSDKIQIIQKFLLNENAQYFFISINIVLLLMFFDHLVARRHHIRVPD